MAIGYVIVFIPNFLVYDIQIDPLWGMLFAPIILIPFLYGAVKYEMLNVKIIAKQAFLFALAVSIIGGIITLFNYSNIWIQQLLPTFPLWVSAFVSAVLTVILSVVIWQRLRKNDLMRYEFITTVTHKFRTPLTHIKWSAENISNAQVSGDVREQLGNIVSANAKLVELTDLLVKASEIERGDDIFHTEKMDLSYVVKGIVGSLSKQIQLKKLTTDKQIAPDLLIIGVASKIQFVVQTLIENSISYTRSGGVVTIKTERRGNDALFSVTDTGIGIPHDELSLLFSKFYRATNARLEDTEGMGIGLFISKQIIEQHDGKIWAESAGEGKGSTFSFLIPLIK
jgi:signal transduction histidine kinase